MTIQDHEVDICEYARNCSPYDEDERGTWELLNECLDQGLIDYHDDCPGVDLAEDEYQITDEDAAREYLLEQLGISREISDFLEVEIFRSTTDPNRYIAEFLLGCGGPTVRVTVDQFQRVTLFHSWGYHPHYPESEHCEWEICDANRDDWIAVADVLAGVDA